MVLVTCSPIFQKFLSKNFYYSILMTKVLTTLVSRRTEYLTDLAIFFRKSLTKFHLSKLKIMRNLKSFLCLTSFLLVWSFLLSRKSSMKECKFTIPWFMTYILSFSFHEDWISRIRLDLGRTLLWKSFAWICFCKYIFSTFFVDLFLHDCAINYWKNKIKRENKILPHTVTLGKTRNNLRYDNLCCNHFGNRLCP